LASFATNANPKRDPQAEIEKITAQLAVDPNQPELLFHRSQLYGIVPARSLQVQDLDACIPVFEQRYADPKMSRIKEIQQRCLQFAYADRGAANRELGHIKEAIDDFSKAISFGPNFSDYYKIRANLYERAGKPELAQKDRTRAAKLSTTSNDDESFFQTMSTTQRLAQKTYKLEELYKGYTQALKIRPNSVFALWFRSEVLRKMGKFKLALADTKELIKLQPQDPFWKHELQILTTAQAAVHGKAIDETVSEAQMHEAESLGDSRDSNLKPLAEINAYVARHPGDERGYRAQAEALVDKHSYKEALKPLGIWVLLDPQNPVPFKLRASCRQTIGDISGAISDYTAALDSVKLSIADALVVVEGEEDLHFARAACYFSSNQFAKALQDYTAIVEKQPRSEEAFKGRGDCLVKLHQYSRAVANYSQAIALDNNSQGAIYAARAEVYKKLGQNDLAEKDLAMATKLGTKKK
jgi:tetratricopeptide (TPR) repeat protein